MYYHVLGSGDAMAGGKKQKEKGRTRRNSVASASWDLQVLEGKQTLMKDTNKS